MKLKPCLAPGQTLSIEEGRKLMSKATGHQLEAVVLDQCRSYLRTLGWFVVRNQQSMGSHKGLSDLTAVKDGRVLFIECKATKGVQSEHQRKFQACIEGNGGTYWLVHSLDEMIEQSRGIA